VSTGKATKDKRRHGCAQRRRQTNVNEAECENSTGDESLILVYRRLLFVLDSLLKRSYRSFNMREGMRDIYCYLVVNRSRRYELLLEH